MEGGRPKRKPYSNGFLVTSLCLGVVSGWMVASYLLKQNTYLAAVGIVLGLVMCYPVFEELFRQLHAVKESGASNLGAMSFTSVLFGGLLCGLIFKLASVKHMFFGFYILYLLATRVI